MENSEEILETVAEMLVADEMYEVADIIRQAQCDFEVTGYDNWNGGTDIYTLYVRMPVFDFAKVKNKQDSIEAQISERLQVVVGQISDDFFSVSLVPKIEKQTKWRVTSKPLDKTIRRNIFDGIRIEDFKWYGSLNDTEFLGRIFDLEKLPSHDSRFSNAAGDIWQHRFNNDDWDDDWIFGDTRFNLIECSDEIFLQFLSEMVNPVVRPDRDEALRMVSHFNDQLREAGWNLVEEEMIAGRPRFVAKRDSGKFQRSHNRARSVADALDASWMHKEIQRLEHSVERDPALAIGTAKELVESCCKTILTKIGKPPGNADNLPKLAKSLAKELKLVPDDIPKAAKGAETIRILLSNFSSIIQGLAELRGLYGSGHGRDGQYRGLEPRHARLAVGAAVAFIDFVTETYQQRQLNNKDDL